MDLNDLKKSITEMSEEELYTVLRETRQSRRTSKRAPTVAKSQSKPQTTSNPKAVVSAMSPEMMKQLLAKLEGMKK